MISFILRRLMTLIPLLLGITMLAFILMSLAPGDFLTPVKAQRDVSVELIQAIESEFGLDQPWYIQYYKWLGNVLQGNLGHSWAYKLPVSELIGQRIWATFLLSFSSLIFSWMIAIPLGVLAAIEFYTQYRPSGPLSDTYYGDFAHALLSERGGCRALSLDFAVVWYSTIG